MVPLRIVIITKMDPLKKSLPKFAQPGTGCVAPVTNMRYESATAACVSKSSKNMFSNYITKAAVPYVERKSFLLLLNS